MKKLFTRKELGKIIQKLKNEGKKIGFTSGSFDILHAGHVSYLEKAKKKCDVLIVGVNSDESVKKYKGKDRPIVNQKDRIKVITGLESIDYAFLFDERRNKKNIKEIKPDFYIKAGDYKENELTSAKYLKPWNGKVILIEPEKGISTTQIINKIKLDESIVYGNNINDSTTKNILIAKPGPAIFLDRDGVINENVHFLHEPDKFKFLPGVIRGLKTLQDMKYKLVIVTNQAGIGLGYFNVEDFFLVNSKMLKELSNNGVLIDKIYFCPHHLKDACECRKPEVGMFLKAKKDLNIDMSHSFTIGDMDSDIEAGNKAGTKTILLNNIESRKNQKNTILPDFQTIDFIKAVDWIKKMNKLIL